MLNAIYNKTKKLVIMRKISLMLFVLSFFAIVSCQKDEEEKANERFIGNYLETGTSTVYMYDAVVATVPGTDTLFVTAADADNKVNLEWAKSPKTEAYAEVSGNNVSIPSQEIIWDEGGGEIKFDLSGTGVLENSILKYDATLEAIDDTTKLKLMVTVSAAPIY